MTPRRFHSGALALALALVGGCGPEAARDTPSADAAPGESAPGNPSLGNPSPGRPSPDNSSTDHAVAGLANPGFELVVDSTTDPPKYGAYWVGAFMPVPDSAADLIVSATESGRPAHGGERYLRLPTHRTVRQKIVALKERPAPDAVSLAVRLADATALHVTLEDGPGRRTTIVVDNSFSDPGVIQYEEADDGWTSVWLRPADRFAAEHGESPQPRLVLHLAARGPDGASVEVDDVQATVSLPPTPDAAALSREIEALVRWQLEVWLLEPEHGGLGLVDPATGYIRAHAYDVVTGAITAPARVVSFHSIHRLLVTWLAHARARGLDDEVARWTPSLRRIVTTMLEHNVHPLTGLPRNVELPPAGEPRPPRPLDDQPVTVGAYIEFLLDALPLLDDDKLSGRTLQACRRMADTLLRLAAEHDREEPNTWDLEQGSGILRGRWDNWYGHIPNKLDPQGAIETPRRFNTAWAIVTGRSFWYHLFQSPAAIMRVHELDPRPSDLPALRKALSRFEREWDAHRYQLENDTDDHYGYLCKDVLALLHHSPQPLPEALALVQSATDHRLARDGGAGDTLWVQGARLGTPCAGDSPRAILGLVELWSLPPRLNPETAGLPLYRDAVLELAASDFKGRQLTNGQFTESFFKNWEMVCICFRGNLQDDCRSPPPEGWHGDVGDTFGGPPTSAIDAQLAAWRVAGDDPALRREILARLALIHRVTEQQLRRPHGYLFGLDTAIAEQYGLPEKYTIGLSSKSAAGLGYVMAWANLLPHLDTSP